MKLIQDLLQPNQPPKKLKNGATWAPKFKSYECESPNCFGVHLQLIAANGKPIAETIIGYDVLDQLCADLAMSKLRWKTRIGDPQELHS